MDSRPVHEKNATNPTPTNQQNIENFGRIAKWGKQNSNSRWLSNHVVWNMIQTTSNIHMVQISFRNQSDNGMKYSQQKKGGRDNSSQVGFFQIWVNGQYENKLHWSSISHIFPIVLQFTMFWSMIFGHVWCWNHLILFQAELLSLQAHWLSSVFFLACHVPIGYLPAAFCNSKTWLHWWMTLACELRFSMESQNFSGGHRTEETIPTVFFDLSDYVGQLSDWQHVWVCWNVFSIGLWKHPGLVIKTDRSWPSIVTQIVSHEISAVCHVVCIIRSNTYFLSK